MKTYLLQMLKEIALLGALRDKIEISSIELASQIGTSQQTASRYLLELDKMGMITKTNIAEVILILFGVFLIIDSLFLGLLTFNYPAPIAFLNKMIDHWMIGFLFIIAGIISLGAK